MRPRISIAIAGGLLTVALAAAAASAAITTGDYWGDVNGDPYPGSSLGFDVKKKDSGKKKVKNINASGLDFTCDGGSPGETSAVFVEGSFLVEHKEFGGHMNSVILGFDPHGKFEGKFKGHGVVKGTISVHGKLDPQNQPDTKCDTGVQDWKVEKGAQPPVW